MKLSLPIVSIALAFAPLFAVANPSAAFAQAKPPATTSTASPATVPGASQPAPAPSATPAPAVKPPEDFLKRFTLNFAPGYFFASGGDDAPARLGDRTTHLFYNTPRRNADIIRFDYGAAFAIDPKTSLSFSHGNVAYQLGRILIGSATELSSGEIVDYTDTYALNHSLGHGLGIHATYFNHQRSSASQQTNPALCLNQKRCTDPVTGAQFNNPNSIDEHGYTFGAAYDFGPTSKIGKVFSAAIDAKYVPRPSSPVNPAPGRPGTLATALQPDGSYRGSQVLYPYSFTVKLPITNSSTFIPFVNYTNLPVLYRDSSVPEAYRGIVFGFVKVINKNATLSYTNLNLQTCRCIPRVPPPDNLRLAFGILKLDFHTQL
ncbi:MAG: hypothetical protein NVS2B3_17610 [Vulcanimicrobiaceae bacterium]